MMPISSAVASEGSLLPACARVTEYFSPASRYVRTRPRTAAASLSSRRAAASNAAFGAEGAAVAGACSRRANQTMMPSPTKPRAERPISQASTIVRPEVNIPLLARDPPPPESVRPQRAMAAR